MVKGENNIFKKYLSYILVCISICLMPYSACLADQDQAKPYHCVTQYENGSINWTTGKITAVGKAFPDEKMQTSNEWIQGAARADANRGVIKILKGIKLSKIQRVEEYAAKSDIILAGIEKTARDAVILKQYYTSALAVEMTIETSIFGGFLQLVLPEDIRQIPKISPDLKKRLKVNTGSNTNSTRSGLSTGLIIDARGLEFEPVLNPAIVSEQGHDMYSSVFISREFAVQKGVCKYYCSMKQALSDRRVGNNPLIFKGLRKEGKENTNIVINMADYRRWEKSAERHVFLKECRVIIVMDL